MKKTEYLERLQYENKNHISNVLNLIKTLNLNISKLKRSKANTDRICERFDIRCYNYNLVYEMEETKNKFIKDLENLIKEIQKIVNRKSKNVDYDIQKVSSINDLLYTYEVQLNSINRIDLSNIESLQINAIKKEIYEKYMRIRSNIDRSILKVKFDKIQNKNAVLKALDNFFVLTEFVGKQKENLFLAIQGIDDCNSKFIEMSQPTREYKIIDIVADIDMYIHENKKARRYKEKYNELLDLREKINYTFSIEKKEIKRAINEKYKSKYPMPIEKNVHKIKNKHQKAIEFLYKSGYINTYENVEYRPKMALLIEKIKLISESVEKQLNK